MVKRIFIGLLLTIIAFVSSAFLFVIGFLYASVVAVHKSRYKQYLYYIGSILWAFAYCVDCLGCVVLGPYLNRHYKSPLSNYSFGSPKYTISLIIGYIYYETDNYGDNLLPQGKKCHKFLEWIEPGHCQLAIADFETPVIYKNPFYL